MIVTDRHGAGAAQAGLARANAAAAAAARALGQSLLLSLTSLCSSSCPCLVLLSPGSADIQLSSLCSGASSQQPLALPAWLAHSLGVLGSVSGLGMAHAGSSPLLGLVPLRVGTLRVLGCPGSAQSIPS